MQRLLALLVHLQPPHELLSFLCRLQRPAHALSFALLWQHAHNPPNRVIHTEHEHPDGAFRPWVLFLRALADVVETQWRVALEKMICRRSLLEKSMQFFAAHVKAASRAENCTITFSTYREIRLSTSSICTGCLVRGFLQADYRRIESRMKFALQKHFKDFSA